jgi:two-component system chemotaxis response regulator CheY
MARILVVDDSGLSRRISRTILEEAGHEVIDVEDGIGAVERFYLDKPDLVLLDITMRGMSGFEVLEKLREIDPQVRVVVATADIQSSTREMTRQGGAMGFVTKPFVGEQVTRIVAAVLRGETQWS